MTTAAGAGRRRALADELEVAGDLRSPAWRAAVAAVPREAFLGGLVYRRIDGPGPTLWEPFNSRQAGPDGWLELAYRNETRVTQFDGTDAPLPSPAAP